jgi:hypothetical protein
VPPERAAPARIEIVRDDPAAVDRARVGDDELLALLASAGRIGGLIRVGAEVIFTGQLPDTR